MLAQDSPEGKNTIDFDQSFHIYGLIALQVKNHKRMLGNSALIHGFQALILNRFVTVLCRAILEAPILSRVCQTGATLIPASLMSTIPGLLLVQSASAGRPGVG